jgi:biotin carboxylase
VSDPDEGVAWFAGRPGGRVVVKPPSSAGSDNVWVCGTAAEVAAACRTVLDAPNFFGEPNGVALVQDYLDGEEYLVNSVSRDGEHRIVEVWRSVRLPGPDGACLYDFQEPLSYDAPGVAAVVSYVRQVLDALGIRNGAGHSELRVTAAGPVLLETGARLCGGVLPDVSLRYAGMSQVRLLTLSLLDPAGFAAFEESAVRWSKALRWVSLISDRGGGAASDTWREKLRRLETFDGLVSRVSAGGTVARTVDLATSPGFVYLAADSARAVREDYERLRSLEPNGFYLS